MKQRGLTLIELMVVIALCAIVAAIAIPILLTSHSPERAAAFAAENKAALDEAINYNVKKLVEHTFYWEDPRTGLCFACCWDEDSRFGMRSFTLVPREAIPQELLHTIKIEK